VRYLAVLLFSFLLLGCGRPLPFPTPSQQDLVVLTTQGPLTYVHDENGSSGLEHDLATAFAEELGVGIQFIVVAPDEIEAKLAAGKGHFAIGWLPQTNKQSSLNNTPPITQSHDIIIQHEASLPIDELADLHGKTVHALRGSRQVATLRKLQESLPDLAVVEQKDGDIYSLLEALDSGRIDLAVIDSSLVEIALQFIPSLQASFSLNKDQAVVWWLGPNPNPELLARTNHFVETAQRDGTLARLEDRYFGHVRRLKQGDIVAFLERIGSLLPKFRQHFLTAEKISGIDWRLIAAVAYHESQWDPNATSPTGVRGIMMLTEETADRLDVSNRLNPRESILAGARYINMLRNQQPDEAKEPDRTWLALAAYNIGPGNFNAARNLAKIQGADPNAWYEMKRILPLLAQPKYAQKVKAGRARGGEAVILVENIRSYYAILVRNEPTLKKIFEKKPEKKTDKKPERKVEVRGGLKAGNGLKAGSGPGLKLKH
jgi:membrane-bound lytic murein transglycosylase F